MGGRGGERKKAMKFNIRKEVIKREGGLWGYGEKLSLFLIFDFFSKSGSK